MTFTAGLLILILALTCFVMAGLNAPWPTNPPRPWGSLRMEWFGVAFLVLYYIVGHK